VTQNQAPSAGKQAMTCPFPNKVANAEAEIITNIHQFSNENCQFRLVTYGDKI
jgi:hypothetical protein